MKKSIVFAALAAFAPACFAELTEISVDLKLDETNYVSGERVRAEIDVKNLSTDVLSVGYENSPDRLIVEVYRSSDRSRLERPESDTVFTAPFLLKSNEGQRLEVFIGDHYLLDREIRYLARAVLIHDGYRYESLFRSFDVVHGIKLSGALQIFQDTEERREFELRKWSRNGTEHLFLAAKDQGEYGRKWNTHDIGPMMRMTPPTISILPDGKVIVFHRNGADSLVRSEFWSLPDVLYFKSREAVLDPEMAGQHRVQQIYGEAGGVKPVDRPWWKFW